MSNPGTTNLALKKNFVPSLRAGDNNTLFANVISYSGKKLVLDLDDGVTIEHKDVAFDGAWKNKVAAGTKIYFNDEGAVIDVVPLPKAEAGSSTPRKTTGSNERLANRDKF